MTFTIHLVQNIHRTWIAHVLDEKGNRHFTAWHNNALQAQDFARAWIYLNTPKERISPKESSKCISPSAPSPPSQSEPELARVPVLIPHPQPHDTTGP